MGLGRHYRFPYNVVEYLKPRNYWNNLKHYYQRARFGVSYRDEWSLDYYIDSIFRHSLLKYTNGGDYGPPVLFQDYEDESQGDLFEHTDEQQQAAMDRWDRKIHRWHELLVKREDHYLSAEEFEELKDLMSNFYWGLWW